MTIVTSQNTSQMLLLSKKKNNIIKTCPTQWYATWEKGTKWHEVFCLNIFIILGMFWRKDIELIITLEDTLHLNSTSLLKKKTKKGNTATKN
mgnify:CR=1 FL=1